MLQTCLGIYLVLGLPATVMLWVAMIAAKKHPTDEKTSTRLSNHSEISRYTTWKET